MKTIKLKLMTVLAYCFLFLFIGASGGEMVSKLDKQTFTSELKSHSVFHSYALVPYLNNKLSKLEVFLFIYCFLLFFLL